MLGEAEGERRTGSVISPPPLTQDSGRRKRALVLGGGGWPRAQRPLILPNGYRLRSLSPFHRRRRLHLSSLLGARILPLVLRSTPPLGSSPERRLRAGGDRTSWDHSLTLLPPDPSAPEALARARAHAGRSGFASTRTVPRPERSGWPPSAPSPREGREKKIIK